MAAISLLSSPTHVRLMASPDYRQSIIRLNAPLEIKPCLHSGNQPVTKMAFGVMKCCHALMPSVFVPEKMAVRPRDQSPSTGERLYGQVAMTLAIAASASNPFDHQAWGPSRGSVTFWLATAPTPAHAHRAATAGEMMNSHAELSS